MSLSSLALFALAVAIVAGSPGPGIAALVARILTHGVRDVLPFLAGMWLGEGIWLTLALCGLTVLARSFAALFFALKIAGALYLLFMAWKMWRAPPADPEAASPPARSPLRMFTAGLTVALGNPKIMVFYVALLPTIIDLHGVGFGEWAELAATMLAVIATTDTCWSLLASRARRLFRSRRATRIAQRSSALVMAGAAAAVATH